MLPSYPLRILSAVLYLRGMWARWRWPAIPPTWARKRNETNRWDNEGPFLELVWRNRLPPTLPAPESVVKGRMGVSAGVVCRVCSQTNYFMLTARMRRKSMKKERQ